jgi:PTH1 family peptidyl-tRNA hydrolase
MKLIIGLGNPGTQYERTRHNVGFHVVDTLATKYSLRWERRNRALLASGTIGAEKIVLVKPITFMNNSGEAVGELVHWHKVQPEEILVVYDDLDLPVGQIRLRPKGSAGGHNGLNSIIHHLHTDGFPRLRVGIGRPTNRHMDTVDYVLGTASGDEGILLATAESNAVDAVPLILQQGVGAAMNILNADPEALRKAEEKRRLQQERREQARLRRQEEQATNQPQENTDQTTDKGTIKA